MAKPKATVDKSLCRLVTCEFRMSYPHLFKPQAPKPTDTPKYSLTMLFDKKKDLTGMNPADGSPRKLTHAMRNAKLAFFGAKENWPDNLVDPVNDGDDPSYADKEGYKGHWVIKAVSSQDQKPQVVDREMTPITEPALIYPGCYARAHIYAYVWTFGKTQGVGFIVDHVQKLRDGKPFSAKQAVEQVFRPLPPMEESEEFGDEDDEEVSF